VKKTEKEERSFDKQKADKRSSNPGQINEMLK